MAKIISAKDYGFRKVYRVVENPDDPQWVHVDDNGVRTPAPAGETGDTVEAEQRGKTLCPNIIAGSGPQCVNNWQVEEYTFTAAELQMVVRKPDGSTSVRYKTDDELVSEVKALHAARIAAQNPSAPKVLENVEGLVF